MTQQRVLVAYATKHGSTREVADTIARTLEEHALEVDVHEAAEVKSLDGYDAVVLGGALYMGRWHPHARRFLRRHHERLHDLPVAVFAMGPQDLEPEHVAQSRTQLDNALGRVSDVEPVTVAIFGGAIDPAKLSFPFSKMKSLDARDWDAIRGWSDEVAASVGGRTPAGA